MRADIGRFEHEDGTVAFRAQGTAVRARGRVRPPRPFVSHLDAQEFAKLIAAGWVPVDLVLGIAVEGMYRRQTGRFARNGEVRGWNDAVASVRRRARNLLTYEAAQVGADGVVISGTNLRVHLESAERFVEARIIGTAIAGFGPNRPRSSRRRAGLGRRRASRQTSLTLRPEPSSPALSIMRLSPDAPDRR